MRNLKIGRRVRIAVVGAGQIGRHHCRTVSESDMAELVAVVDPDPTAEPIAYAARAEWLTSIADLLSGPLRIDAAIVAVPTVHHAPVTIPLLEEGLAVLVEKPIAHSAEAAVAMIDVARTNNVPLRVGHVERFNPAVRALQDHLHRETLGRVFQVCARRLSPFPPRVGDAGVALDLATHDLDLMCQLAGDPIRVSAEIDQKAHRSHEDLLAATLRFDSGIIGLLEVNWLTPTKVRRLIVTGESGTFVVDYLNQHLTLYENARATTAWEALDIFDGVTEGNVIRYAIARTEPLRAQLEAFVSAARGEHTVVATAEEGLRALSLALLAIESGSIGRTITISDGLLRTNVGVSAP